MSLVLKWPIAQNVINASLFLKLFPELKEGFLMPDGKFCLISSKLVPVSS